MCLVSFGVSAATLCDRRITRRRVDLVRPHFRAVRVRTEPATHREDGIEVDWFDDRGATDLPEGCEVVGVLTLGVDAMQPLQRRVDGIGRVGCWDRRWRPVFADDQCRASELVGSVR